LKSALALLAIWPALIDASGSPVELAGGEADEAGDEGVDAVDVEVVETVEFEVDEHAVMSNGSVAAATAAAFALERIGFSWEVGSPALTGL
jgi:hypothetical protein